LNEWEAPDSCAPKYVPIYCCNDNDKQAYSYRLPLPALSPTGKFNWQALRADDHFTEFLLNK
jgi:hypothetical protein